MNKKLLVIALGLFVVLSAGFLSFQKKSSNQSVEHTAASAQAVHIKTSETVELKNGDTFALSAGYVEQEIGGVKQKMLAYNGSIPGPTIKVAQGAEVTINFTNNTDLPAALHSHGVRMDNAFDGAPPVTQPEIAPGGSFVYKLKFPDAGIFWYHSHVGEVYEQPLGLYGAFIVAPKDAAYYAPVNREAPLFLTDLPVDRGAITIQADTKDHALMGHFGNIMLINGQEHFSLAAQKGEVLRLYVINAANARPYKFAIAGAKLKVVGSDNGAYEKAFWADSVTLGPAERAIVDVLFAKQGTYELQNKTPEKTYSLGDIVVSDEAVETSYSQQFKVLQSNKTVSQSIDPFRKYFNSTPDKQLSLAIQAGGTMPMSGMGMGRGPVMPSKVMPDHRQMMKLMMASTKPAPGGIEWEDDDTAMSGLTTDDLTWAMTDTATGKKNADIDWRFKRGQAVKIRIFNDPAGLHPMQHPIHFHGQRFILLDRDGKKETNLVWKDTVLVPIGQTVDILLDASNPGTWMAHCHISEHLAAHMMFNFKVE